MMDTEASPGGAALEAFDAMAPVYDDFTAHHDYETWLGDLLKVLADSGLEGLRLLDVACGTGKSFLPMLRWGWQVTGCDISPAMLALAAEKAGEDVHLSVADMRDLPVFGEFDLVWALDDAINYLLSFDELVAALQGMRRNLSPGGLVLFDVNELIVYRTFYAQQTVIERNGRRLVWQGLSAKDVPAASTCESRLEVQADSGEGSHPIGVSLHRQRHFPEAEVARAIEQAGLSCLEIYGHGLDGVPRQPLDVDRHTKAVYVAASV
jgi:ubiquinone/menaquinone biosynthesis C-methylase UbiE